VSHTYTVLTAAHAVKNKGKISVVAELIYDMAID
jgi:hypothetical protein